MTNPDYYAYPIQPLEFIVKNGLPYCQGSVIKYVCRAGRKGTLDDAVLDCQKAIRYLEEMIKEFNSGR
jgi:hypothetical protein